MNRVYVIAIILLLIISSSIGLITYVIVSSSGTVTQTKDSNTISTSTKLGSLDPITLSLTTSSSPFPTSSSNPFPTTTSTTTTTTTPTISFPTTTTTSTPTIPSTPTTTIVPVTNTISGCEADPINLTCANGSVTSGTIEYGKWDDKCGDKLIGPAVRKSYPLLPGTKTINGLNEYVKDDPLSKQFKQFNITYTCA